MAYAWVLWFHVISLIAWYAVLFYLPRLYVYHQEHADNKDFIKVMKVMEYKLYAYIGLPAFWATLGSGIALIVMSKSHYGVSIFALGGWFHAKLLFLVFLIVYFFSLGIFRRRLENDTCTRSGRFFRWYNEIPTILLLLIVAMVIVKPF